MLVLTRELNQKIIIGHDIEVMIVEVRGGKVKLGISAPQDVSVDREEVRISKESATQKVGRCERG